MHRVYTLALVLICAAVGGLVSLVADNVSFLMAFGAALGVCVVGVAAIVLRENPPKRQPKPQRPDRDRPSR